MTLVEVLIALLILGFTTAGVMRLIVTGDRIGGRRAALSYATICAKNEVERLKASETSLVLPKDTAYSDTVNGIEYDVSRVRIVSGPPRPDSIVVYQEYVISVKRKQGAPVAVSFRILQGYNGENTQ